MAMRLILAGLALLAPASAAAAPHVSDFGMPLGGAHARPAGAVIEPGRRFDLVGLRWHGRGELRGGRIRTRSHGRWRPWVPLDSGGRGTDPVWAGGADALQLRWRAAPRGLRLRFVRVTHRVRLPAP